jgi:hypothetical protein
MMRIETVPGRQAWHPLLWAAVAFLLLLPLVAMQFTREVAWTRFDFVVAALLLGGGAGLYEIAYRMIRTARARRWAAAAILAGVALIWAQGAVGIV